MGRRVTKADLAEIVGRDERTLSRWQREGMPVVSVGLGRGNENEYDTEDVIGWLVQVASSTARKNRYETAWTGCAPTARRLPWPAMWARWRWWPIWRPHTKR